MAASFGRSQSASGASDSACLRSRSRVGRHADWVAGCKTGSATGSAFAYASKMTEAILLGNVAYRVGRRIEWDAEAMKAKGCPEADALLKRPYRPGWVL